ADAGGKSAARAVLSRIERPSIVLLRSRASREAPLGNEVRRALSRGLGLPPGPSRGRGRWERRWSEGIPPRASWFWARRGPSAEARWTSSERTRPADSAPTA